MKKELELCYPCCVKLGDHFTLKKVREVVDKKITCAECRRRRFGAVYEVLGKEKRE